MAADRGRRLMAPFREIGRALGHRMPSAIPTLATYRHWLVGTRASWIRGPGIYPVHIAFPSDAARGLAGKSRLFRTKAMEAFIWFRFPTGVGENSVAYKNQTGYSINRRRVALCGKLDFCRLATGIGDKYQRRPRVHRGRQSRDFGRSGCPTSGPGLRRHPIQFRSPRGRQASARWIRCPPTSIGSRATCGP